MAFSLLVALAVGASLDVSDPWTSAARPDLHVDIDDPWTDATPTLDRLDPWASTRLSAPSARPAAAIDRSDPWAP